MTPLLFHAFGGWCRFRLWPKWQGHGLAGKSPKKRLVGQGSGLRGRSDRVTRLKMLPQPQRHHLACLKLHTFMTRAGIDTAVDAGLDCSSLQQVALLQSRLQQVALLQSTKLHCSTLKQSFQTALYSRKPLETPVHANCSSVNAPSPESRRHLVSLQMKPRLFANEAIALHTAGCAPSSPC